MRDLLARLTGYSSPVRESFVDKLDQDDFWLHHRIGFSQLNEMLLALAYETITEDFFERFFCEGRPKVEGLDRVEFERGIETFEKIALLKYGNVKFGFKTLGGMHSVELDEELRNLCPIPESEYTGRPSPLQSITAIDPAETYFLGHITGEDILKGNNEQKKRRLQEVRQIGIANTTVYLCSDEMDVYIATSMRDIEDFYFVGTIAAKLFGKPELDDLKLRYFDPTQSFCDDRIEKGLVESLMLRRARCTVYCAQTTETLGKDSELAVTLAQGKPVIVYVPQMKDNDERYRVLCREVARIHSEVYGCNEDEYYRLKLVERHAKKLYAEGTGIRDLSREQLEDKLVLFDDQQFERKATLLREKHPLGIQVDLDTGVANGVLVVRTLTECAHVMKQVLTNTLNFKIERDTNGTLRLVEERTGCTYRLMVSDPVLTNSFWNFYRPWITRNRPRDD